jgi:alpha-L-arabinofuranosidase
MQQQPDGFMGKARRDGFSTVGSAVRTKGSRLACGVGLLLTILGTATAAEPTATIRVNLQEEKAPVPATLNGIFMEEISHAFDGGIYGELIQNRSFEEGVLPPGMKLVTNANGSLQMELAELPAGVPTNKWHMPWPWNGNCGWDTNRALLGWTLQNEGGAKGAMSLTEAHPMNAASTRSLAMTIAPPEKPEGRVALVNSGYWGIHVQAGTPYRLKFHLRPESFRGRVTATLEAKDGKVLARHEFGEVKRGTAWKEYTATLAAEGTDARARLVLSFRGEGALQVDWVSLFPPTFKQRPNGLRQDLANYLAELKPAFIRYPGGCYVEGLSWASAPDWRKMVCPPEERPGTWGYWKYRSTDGFGYHEFLEFCEDIGADGMYVAFAGMTVHPDNNMPLENLDPTIQQTLDAIEYALGPVSSKWGAVRARMGHPKPFPLKYVEIGNEHPPAIYGDYYKKFRTAIKARHPEIQVVMSMFWSGLNPGAIARAGDDAIDIVDEHSYRGSGWIRSNFDYFDRYPRKPWKIYVGEYAHHHGNGDWSAAMDDAVYLMMLERNGDLVRLASYAPLFCNVNQRDWGVNLIEFDAARSFAHASYYVQKMFHETRPAVNLATTAEVSPKPDPTRPLMAGKFGLGAWNTQTEFKDLRIYDDQGQVVYQDDFQTLDKWETPGIGAWRAENGVLQQTDKGRSPAMLLLKTPELKTGRVTLKARRVGGSEGFLMFFNAANIDRFLFCNYGAAGNSFTAIQDRGVPDGCAFKCGRSTPGKIENDRWYEISLTLGRDKAELFLDGKLVSDARMEYLPAFFATSGYDPKARTVVVRAVNYGKSPLQTDLQLEGAETVGTTGEHLVLHGIKPEEENSLADPLRITPQKLPLANCAARFPVTLPPYSVNVLRIPAQKK